MIRDALRADDVHVVVVNWNSGEETCRCLAALAALAPTAGRVHVVDNGSVDDSKARIAREHPQVVLHANPENRGFAGGANVGVAAALASGARAVWLMNNDARPDADALGRLVEAARRLPECGLYGPKIFRDRAGRVLWSCGVEFRFGPNLARLRGFDEVDVGRYETEEVVASLTGCGLLVRAEVFARIGLLDESYFAYVEDADFCARAADAGFLCLYVPTSLLEHPGGGASGGGYGPGRKYLTAHGAARFLRRHGTVSRWMSFLIFDLFLWPGLFVVAAAEGRGLAAFAKLCGSLAGACGRRPNLGWLKARTRLQRSKSVGCA